MTAEIKIANYTIGLRELTYGDYIKILKSNVKYEIDPSGQLRTKDMNVLDMMLDIASYSIAYIKDEKNELIYDGNDPNRAKSFITQLPVSDANKLIQKAMEVNPFQP